MTNQSRFATAVALGAIIWSSPVLAQEGPFIGLQAGWAIPSSISMHSTSGPASTGKVALGGAAEIAGEFGYNFLGGLSTGVEVALDDFGARHTVVNGTQNAIAPGGDISETAVLGTIAYEIPYRYGINWIAGAAAGVAQLSPDLLDATDTRLSANSTSFAWQLMAGANWAFTPVFLLQLDYRFRSVLDSDHNYGPTPVRFGSLSSQGLMVSLRWLIVAPG